MEIDTQKIENLLEEKKYDELKIIIDEAVSAESSEQEKGAGLVGIASVYMDISNAISARYRKVLEGAIESMKKINSAENKIVEESRLAEIRQDLNK